MFDRSADQLSGASMDKLNILVSLITEDNDYQLEQAASAQVAARKLGASVQVIYANNDAVLQTQQILQFVQDPARRPNAIVVEPVGTGMLQVAKAAVSAGIGWVVINAGVDYLAQLRQHAMVPVFSVLSDHEEIGRIQGKQMAAILGDEGCVLYIEGPAVRDVARMRTKGMMSTKPPKVTIKTLKGDWTQQSGYHAIRSWLGLSTSRELHVGMIACQNDDMAFGARRAFEEFTDMKERDSWLALPITGCDGVPKAGQTWVRQGRLAATIFSPPLVGDAIQLLASSRTSGTQCEERTLVAPSSFPALTDLKRKSGTAAGKS
ncbi:MAG TPA: substrate-binding domain-containing protein [Candidatus Dormibacteraeota bacterium]|nr:substrate-binding domain-containing protein [Candidatus Dormibacteraeota bacterium]